jgi:hypothetical protein
MPCSPDHFPVKISLSFFIQNKGEKNALLKFMERKIWKRTNTYTLSFTHLLRFFSLLCNFEALPTVLDCDVMW